jgi:hypothetical protein
MFEFPAREAVAFRRNGRIESFGEAELSLLRLQLGPA